MRPHSYTAEHVPTWRAVVAIVALVIAMIGVSVLAAACSDKSTNNRTGIRPNPFVGITQTDETGTVLSLDPDDWCDDMHGSGGVPTVYALPPAYPNPTDGVCTITFALPEKCDIALSVRQWVGRIHVNARMLAFGEYEPGVYTVVWDGRDDAGELLADDVYRVCLTANTYGESYGCQGDIQITHL